MNDYERTPTEHPTGPRISAPNPGARALAATGRRAPELRVPVPSSPARFEVLLMTDIVAGFENMQWLIIGYNGLERSRGALFRWMRCLLRSS
jgi:hypothetical protein